MPPASKTKPARASKKTPAGRPSLFTEERRATFVQAVQLGASTRIAAQAAGWSQRLAQVYLQRARQFRAVEEADELDDADHPPLTDEEGVYAQFARDVEKAEAEMLRGSLAAVIRAAQKGTWQAAAWLLERTCPETYARRTQVELSGRDGGPVEVEVTTEDLLAQLAKITDEAQKTEEWQRSRTTTRPGKVVNLPPAG